MLSPLERFAGVLVMPSDVEIRSVNYRFRLLGPGDAEMLDRFLRSLSESTTVRWGAQNPETLTAAEACAKLGQDGSIRIIAEVPDQSPPVMAAYIVLQEQVPGYERERFAEFGLKLDAQALRVAPVVADAYQGKGIGVELMRWTISLAHELGVSQLVLWGGVHDDNVGARRLYEKVGFTYSGSFYWRKPELSPDPVLYHYMSLDVAGVVGRSKELIALCEVQP